MTRFEKIGKRAELLETAYLSIIERDKWDNLTYENDFKSVREDRIEEHALYLSIASEIEKLL